MTQSQSQQRPQVLYNYGDKVSFIFDGIEYVGTIGVIDRFGIFFDDSEPYYDIDMPKEKIFVKHVPQSSIIEKVG